MLLVEDRKLLSDELVVDSRISAYSLTLKNISIWIHKFDRAYSDDILTLNCVGIYLGLLIALELRLHALQMQIPWRLCSVWLSD